KWNAASQRFEHTDGWNSRELLAIEAAGNVYGGTRAREGGRHVVIRNPTGMLDSCVLQRSQGVRRIAYPVHACPQPERPRRLDQKLGDFPAALVVAPVAHPHEIQGFPHPGQWMKHTRIGRLVPRPGLPGPAVSLIVRAQHRAK